MPLKSVGITQRDSSTGDPMLWEALRRLEAKVNDIVKVLAERQSPSPGTQQAGSVNVSGNLLAGGNVGAGTQKPLARLHAVETGTATPRGLSNDQISNDGFGAHVFLRKAYGTPAAPAAVPTATTIGGQLPMAHDGIVFDLAGHAKAVTAETWAPGAHGSDYWLLVVKKGTTAPYTAVKVTSEGSVVLAVAGALATTATDGFTYIPSCAGAPTGAPTAQAGTMPLVYDSVNDKIYVYSGGVWKKVALA